MAAAGQASPSLPSTARDRVAIALLALSIFATGLSGLVAEFILGTVSSYILGNSVEQFSIIIALMMLMMGVAGLVQRALPDRGLVTQFVLVEAALALLAGFAPLAIYAAHGWLEHHFMLVLYFFVASIGFGIGFELPLVLRINARYVERLSGNLALILSLDYVGGFIGAIIWTRWLLPELPLTESSFVVAGANFAIAAVTFAWLSRDEPAWRRLVVAAAIAGIAALLVYGGLTNRTTAEHLEQRLYDDRIVLAETTRYQRVVLTENPLTGDLRLFLNGNLQVSSLDEAIYHEQLVHPAMTIATRRARVLVLGGGDGLAVREILKYPEVERVDLVDLDPRITSLAREDARLVELNGGSLRDARVHAVEAPGVEPGVTTPVFMEAGRAPAASGDDHPEAAGARPEPRVERVAYVHIMNVDADRFLAGAEGRYDVAIVDLPDPSSVELTKLYSREFYAKLRRRLAPGGVVVVQATSPVHAREVYLGIRRTLEAAGFATLPYHDNVPSFGDWGFVLGRPAPAGDPESLARARATLRAEVDALDHIAVETRYLTPELVRAALAFGKGALESESGEVNTLMRPWLFDAYLRESWLVD